MIITLEDLRKAANEIIIQIGILKDISKLTRLELEGIILSGPSYKGFDEEELSEETQAIFWGITNSDIGYSEEKDLTQFN